MLLRFRFSNHRSVREPVELSLVASGFSGTRPEGHDWIGVSNRVAAIYGPNGSGKSNVLDALDFFHRAVRLSATSWGGRETFPYHPFRLDEESKNQNSSYEMDLVVNDVRYVYGFESDRSGVKAEWLYSWQTNRRTTLFERSIEQDEIYFGRRFAGQNHVIEKLTRPTALFLSTAANSNHKICSEVRRGIINCARYARYTERDRQERLNWTRKQLENKETFERAESLIRYADLGIVGLELVEHDVDETALDLFKRITKSLADPANYTPEDESAQIEKFVEAQSKQVEFKHRSADGHPISLHIGDESSGTVAWLSLVVPALYVLERGHLQIIDELDASLHPRLSAALVRLFKDPLLNPKGAQLLFTSHDTALMGNLLGEVLDPGEIWFTEKGSDGATELYSLEEFPTRSTDNIEKRYLEGRYGALPVVQSHELTDVLSDLA